MNILRAVALPDSRYAVYLEYSGAECGNAEKNRAEYPKANEVR
jgi:hypothetical protein